MLSLPIAFTPPSALMIWAAYVLMVAIAVDTGAGVLKALAKHAFHLSLAANFLKTAVVPLVGPSMLLYLLAMAIPQAQGIALSFVGVAILKLLADIGTKLGVNLGQVTAAIAGTLGLSSTLAATVQSGKQAQKS